MEVVTTSEEVRARVNKARQIQVKRYQGSGVKCNARLTPSLLTKFCQMTDDAEFLLKSAFDRLGLSARAYDRILKVARTIADLDNAEKIDTAHIAEAIHFRSLDRKYWGE